MIVDCATCEHFPGHGALCPVAKRHATAHPKRCAAYRFDPARMDVARLRTLARDFRTRRDGQRFYAVALAEAHKAAKGTA